jgi:hypothetical protein
MPGRRAYASSGRFGTPDGSIARTATQEQLRAHDVRVAWIEGEDDVTVGPVSDWSLPLDPDPLHGVRLSIQASPSPRSCLEAGDPDHRRDVILMLRPVFTR